MSRSISLLFVGFFLVSYGWTQTIGGKKLSSSWKTIQGKYNPDSTKINDLVFVPGGGIFLCSTKGLYLYMDTISVFYPLSINPLINGGSISSITLHKNQFYTAFKDGYGLYRSTNLLKWEAVGSGKLGSGKVIHLYDFDSILFVCNWQKTIFTTKDRGVKFVNISLGFSTLGKSYINELAHNKEYIFCSMNNDAIYRLSIKKSYEWESCKTGIPDNNYTFGDIAVTDKAVFVVTPVGCFISKNNGSKWDVISNAPKNITRLVCFNNILYAGTSDGQLQYSEDSGLTWKLIPTDEMKGLSISGIAVSPDGLMISVDGLSVGKSNLCFYKAFTK
ncbi:MAG: hypothetical protein MUE33_06270 [Cytophagaceae bacterium]|jgi:hypothetical protein|nr:hypothetical protein [Cytophagaceae bacterium]